MKEKMEEEMEVKKKKIRICGFKNLIPKCKRPLLDPLTGKGEVKGLGKLGRKRLQLKRR